MKALLTAIKTQLKTSLTYVRDSDIYVTEDERMLPDAMKFPAVGIKDGSVAYTRATKSQEDQELQVKIIVYQELQKPEASIMSDTSTSQKGVLDIIGDVITALKNNLFSGEVDSAFPIAESESEFIGDDEIKRYFQMKSVTMQYFRY